jgi:hypothetical protein
MITLRVLIQRRHVRSLRSLWTLGSLKAHPLALGKGLETIALDLREVHEQIVSALLLDKAEAFLIGEPFDCSFWQVASSSHQSRGKSTQNLP